MSHIKTHEALNNRFIPTKEPGKKKKIIATKEHLGHALRFPCTNSAIKWYSKEDEITYIINFNLGFSRGLQI